jgi:Spy/CpxP family protein refolding chaperone
MRSTWKASLLLIATFAGGALAGGAVIGMADRDKLPGRRPHHHHPGSDDHIEYMSRKLNLTPAQKDSVQAILERHKPAMDSIWRQLGPRFETIKDTISNEIRRQLTPEQQQAYAEMIRRFEAERRGPHE